MLKITPRLITLALMLLFGLPIVIQHFVHTMVEQRDVTLPSPEVVQSRRHVKALIEDWLMPVRWLERVDYDIHLRWSDPGPMSRNVAIVEIGERSLGEKGLGQYPFTRTIYKELIERLEKAGARAVAFDATFPEKDARVDLIDELKKLRHEIEQREGFDSSAVRQIDDRIFTLDADEDFATALHAAKVPVVIGFTFPDSRAEIAVSEDLKRLLFDYELFKRNLNDTGMINTYSGHSPVISLAKIMSSLNKASSTGHINPVVDNDSIIRTVPAVLEYDQHILGSLALRAIAAYYGEEPVLDGSDGLAVRGATRRAAAGGDTERVDGKMYFPLNADGTFSLRYYGREMTFPYIEFADIVQDKLSHAELEKLVKDKIIFVGATAQGLKDLRATPFSPNYPGVETHATMASNVLEGSFLLRDHRTFFFGYLFLVVFGTLVSLTVYRMHPFHSFSVTAVSVLAIQLAVLALFNHGVVVPSILPTLCCLMIFFTGVLYRYFTEEREKKATRAAFSRYVSGAVVEEILKDQSKLRLGGQKKELTVMFVDLVEFTRMSEHMDAAFVTQLLNEYFTRMTNILLRNKGTLDKYMGDALMCFWGAPLEIPDHARLACVTALEMREELGRINREWQLKHGIAIENRIGVHTGVMAVGNMGSDQVFSYTAMGDNVNLGSRLEGVNTVYGTHVVVSAATAAKAGNGFLFRPLDRVQVKGREDSVDILELVSAMPAKEPEWVHAFRSGLAHYQAGEWDDAEGAFGACLTLKPGDGPAQVFIDRIRDFRIVAPDEWSGVWKLSSK